MRELRACPVAEPQGRCAWRQHHGQDIWPRARSKGSQTKGQRGGLEGLQERTQLHEQSYRTAGNARLDAPGPKCYPLHVSLRWLERPPQRLRAQEINLIFSFSSRFAYSWYPVQLARPGRETFRSESWLDGNGYFA